jgi:putative NADH-flavin reductase
MLSNEEYLSDLIFDQVDVDRFNQECDSISDQAVTKAREQVLEVDKLAKEMEEHNAVMQAYNEKSETLRKELQKIELYKQKNQPKELAAVIQKRANEVQKEGDKIRK